MKFLEAMANRPHEDHYQEHVNLALSLAELAETQTAHDEANQKIAIAQVHAILAVAAAIRISRS